MIHGRATSTLKIFMSRKIVPSTIKSIKHRLRKGTVKGLVKAIQILKP